MRRLHPAGLLALVPAWLSLAAGISMGAEGRDEVPLTPRGEELLATYTERLESLAAEVRAAAPDVDEGKRAALTTAHGAVAGVPAPPNPRGLEVAPPRYADSNPPYKEAQAKALLAARAILPDVEVFLGGDRLHREMAECALLRHASPRRLAEFAQRGAAEEEVIEELLADGALVTQIMEMGGAHEGKYGEALQIYRAIQEASERAREGFLQRLALGSALEHPDGNIREEGKSAAELMVAMHRSYEQAYLEEKLDPAFDSYLYLGRKIGNPGVTVG